MSLYPARAYRIAKMVIDEPILATMLGFPEGTEIVDIVKSERIGEFVFVIKNDALDEIGPGDHIPLISPWFNVRAPEARPELAKW